MKYYIKFNFRGRPEGNYVDDIFPPREDGTRNASIPMEAIEVSEMVYKTLRDDTTKAFLRGEIVDYIPPPPPSPGVPEYVTRRQFLLALYNYSVTTYNKIIEFVHNHDYPPLAIEFDNALYFYRNSNTLMAVAVDSSLDFTDAQIDQVFVAAGKIAD